MLVPTIWTTSSHSKTRHLSHRRMCLRRKRSPPPLQVSPSRSLSSLRHSSESDRPHKCSYNSEIVTRMFSRIFAFTFSFKSYVTKDGRPLRSSACTLVLPSFTHSLRSSCLHLTLKNLPANFRTNICSVYTPYRPHFTGFSPSSFTTANGKKLWHPIMQYTYCPRHTEDDWPS